jgi:hypothetical protein
VGRDPAGVKRQARIKKTLDVIDAVVDSYLVPFASRNRSAGETKRVLNREVLRAWSGRSIHGVTKRDVVARDWGMCVGSCCFSTVKVMSSIPSSTGSRSSW